MSILNCKQEIPCEMLDIHGGNIVDHVVKRMTEKLCLGIADMLTDGNEYIIRMTPTEIRPGFDRNSTSCTRRVVYDPLVRCKDCKYYEGHEVGWCPKLEKGIFKDFFCALGEEDKHE